jgi:hypothetical protein
LGFICLNLAAYKTFFRWKNIINAKASDLVVEDATSKYKLHLGLVSVERFVV